MLPDGIRSPMVRVLLALAAWLAAYELNVLAGLFPEHGPLLGKPATLVISFAAAALCLLGGLRRRGRARAGWVVVAAGIVAWNVGDTYWTAVLVDEAVIPVPSWADLGYLAFPVAAFVGLGLLMQSSLDRTSRLLLVDGVAAGLALGALAAWLVVGDVLADAGGELVNLGYPIVDLVLLAVVAAAIAVRGWRVDRTWALIGAALLAFWSADTNYSLAISGGSYAFPSALDVGWTGCFLLLAAAAWQPAAAVAPAERLGLRTTVVPLAFALLALGVLAVCGLTAGDDTVAVSLSVGSLVAAGVRLMATLLAYRTMLATSEQEALTDPLTGLGNRRALMLDLRRAVERSRVGAPEVLVLCDLDGFKHYNDSFGHPAGDALLVRLGARLAAGVGPGAQAYRMGGDEFCVLAQLDGRCPDVVADVAVAALADTGSQFTITASHGTVLLPGDAADAESALRVADQRMYARKQSARTSAGRQVSDVLVTALVERDGGLGEHVRDVAELAAGVALRLGLGPQERETVGQAAVLHDVGKVAIPDTILDKPGPLDAAEWAFMHRHTLVGERIIGAAPSLAGVAGIVRASHERWDGAGYPDGIAGEAIPLGARIVAVCDAYDAMHAWRPYSPARPEGAVLAELRRCRGGQFDPRVVDALCAEREAQAAGSGAAPTAVR